MANQRKMMAPKERYYGTEDERAEIALKVYEGEPLTLDECSKVMGLSKSAIKAIECRALSKLRNEIEKRFGKNIQLSDFIKTDARRQNAKSAYPEIETPDC